MGARISPECIRAMELVAAGATVYMAAKECGLSPTTVYQAIKRRKARAVAVVADGDRGSLSSGEGR